MNAEFTQIVRGSGPGLLLAHGAGGSVDANFGAIIDDLAHTHTVIGPDYPGSGATARSTEPLTLDGVADALVHSAARAGVTQFAILGYSLGAAVAVRAATRHPDRVTGLILTAGFAYPSNRLRLVVELWRSLLPGDPSLLATFLTLVASGDKHLDTLRSDDLVQSINVLAQSVPLGSMEHLALVDTVDTRSELPAIVVPTLVIAATLDTISPPESSRALAAAIPRSELVEIEAGHAIAVEAKDSWLTAIQTFLTRIS